MNPVQRLPVMMFFLTREKLGLDSAMTLGQAGITKTVAKDLEAAGLVEVFHYKPVRHQRTRRDYLAISLTRQGLRYAGLLRHALRHRNLAAVDGSDDGHGRVAMHAEWGLPQFTYVADGYLGHRRKIITPSENVRRADMKAAAASAWDKLKEEIDELRLIVSRHIAERHP